MRPATLGRTDLGRTRSAHVVDDDASGVHYPQNDTQYADQTRQLIHDDPFDRCVDDEDIDRVTALFAAQSTMPFTEMLRRLVGLEDLSENDAKDFWGRILEHRADIVKALGRPVHPRVAALDLLTSRPPARGPGARCDSHPIIVTPSMLEKAFDDAAADALTGLPQRTHFTKVLRHELSQRKRRSLCVAYLDLDGFKRVNDVHGHARGDEVLRSLARAARESLREGDVLARLGGDEFGVLLVDALPEVADAVLRRLRDRFEVLTASLGTSFSAGIAVAGAGETAERLLARADEAMYRQKRSRQGALSG